MNISKVFSTIKRISILSKVIYSTAPLTVNRVARELSLSKGLVSKYFDMLVKEKILAKNKNKFVITTNPITKALKILLNIAKFDSRLFKKYEYVKAVGLYGSSSRGLNDENSDIDLWIKVEGAADREMAELSGKLREKLPQIRILFLDRDKISLLKKKDVVFYHSLIFGSHILYGREDEI